MRHRLTTVVSAAVCAVLAGYRLPGSGHTVYSRTLDNALKFLTYQGLASREERQPKQTTYRITDLGRRLAERLTSLEAMVRDHRGARRRHRHPG